MPEAVGFLFLAQTSAKLDCSDFLDCIWIRYLVDKSKCQKLWNGKRASQCSSLDCCHDAILTFKVEKTFDDTFRILVYRSNHGRACHKNDGQTKCRILLHTGAALTGKTTHLHLQARYPMLTTSTCLSWTWIWSSAIHAASLLLALWFRSDSILLRHLASLSEHMTEEDV